MSDAKRIGNPHIPALDGLRAVSIGLVLVSHSVIYEPHEPWLIHAALWCGHTGVSLFFVISGYLITHLLLREENCDRIRLGRFYARRALRIFPACYAYVLTVCLLAAAGLTPLAPPHDYLASILYVRNLVGRGHDTAHLWSLSVEEQFYLCWPALMMLIHPKWRLFATVGLIVSAWGWRLALIELGRVSPGALYIRTDMRIDTILCGCLLALGGSLEHERAKHCERLALLIGIAAWSAWLIVGQSVRATRGFDSVVLPIALTGILCWVLRNPHAPPARLLSTGLFRGIGSLSYSLYLWQQLFLGPRDSPIRQFCVFPLGLVATGIAAVVSYYLIERRFLIFKDRYFSSPQRSAGNAESVC